MSELQLLNPRDLVDSPTNPRKRHLLRGIDELTESVRAKGVLQPIVARPVNGHHEVVFGHRRRVAAIRAELERVPTIVRGFTDIEVLEAQLAENLDRDDMDPLDEADGFGELLRRGQTVAKVAERMGKTRAYVAQRLKLLDLSEKCREALEQEKITLGAALLLARHVWLLGDEPKRDDPAHVEDMAVAAAVCLARIAAGAGVNPERMLRRAADVQGRREAAPRLRRGP